MYIHMAVLKEVLSSTKLGKITFQSHCMQHNLHALTSLPDFPQDVYCQQLRRHSLLYCLVTGQPATGEGDET